MRQPERSSECGEMPVIVERSYASCTIFAVNSAHFADFVPGVF